MHMGKLQRMQQVWRDPPNSHGTLLRMVCNKRSFMVRKMRMDNFLQRMWSLYHTNSGEKVNFTGQHVKCN